MSLDNFNNDYNAIMNNESKAKIESAEFTHHKNGQLYEYKEGSIFLLISFSLSGMEPHKPYSIHLKVTDMENNPIWEGTPPPFAYNGPKQDNSNIPITLYLDFPTNLIKTFKVHTILLRMMENSFPPQTAGVVQDTKELLFNSEVESE